MQEIFNRRSVRSFSDRPIEAEKTETLLRAAMQAPSAANQQPWHFILVRERETRQKLAAATPYAGPAAAAPLVIVMLADADAVQWPDYCPQDMAAAAQNLLLEAVHLDLGAVWLGVAPLAERMEAVRQICLAPPRMQPFAMIAIGYPKDQDNTFIERYQASRIHDERW